MNGSRLLTALTVGNLVLLAFLLARVWPAGRGGGLGLSGASDSTRALLAVEGDEAFPKLTDAKGRRHALAP